MDQSEDQLRSESSAWGVRILTLTMIHAKRDDLFTANRLG